MGRIDADLRVALDQHGGLRATSASRPVRSTRQQESLEVVDG